MQINKGIILAGGSGTRLLPITKIVSKQLLLVYDKPMIYYPLSTLMLMGIKQILIITTKSQKQLFESLLGNGKNLGISISYLVQENPDGLAHAIKISEKFIANEPVVIILGDNMFHGSNLVNQLLPNTFDGSTIYASYVEDPERYGIVEIKNNNIPTRIEEKPKKAKSNYAITGLYFFDKTLISKVKRIKLSSRNELEITDVLELYMKENSLKVKILSRGIAWFDTGTFDSLLDAACYVKTLEQRQGQKICCPEEIAWRNKWISNSQVLELATTKNKSIYDQYLLKLLEEI